MTEEQSKIAEALATVMNCHAYQVKQLQHKTGLSAWFDFINQADAATFIKQMKDQGIPAYSDSLLAGIVFINWASA